MAYARIKNNSASITYNGIKVPGACTFVIDEVTKSLIGLSKEEIESKINDTSSENRVYPQDVLPTSPKEAPAGSIALYPVTPEVWIMGPKETWMVYGGVSNIMN